MAGALLAIIVMVVLAPAGVHARLTFRTGPLANVSVYCSTINLRLGGQYGAAVAAVAAPLHLYDGDPCNGAAVRADAGIAGSAVLLGVFGVCPDEVTYDLFRVAGAAAVIRSVDFYPGVDAYNQYVAARTDPSQNSIFYVEYFAVDLGLDQVRAAAGSVVTVAPDYNVWIDTYSSWPYQTFLRWIPAALFAGAAASSAYFLHQHIRLANLRHQATPRRLPCHFWQQKSRWPMTALLLEMALSAIMSAVMVLSGNSSAAGLPTPVSHFFFTQLSGLAWVVTLISARVWYKVLIRQRGQAASSRRLPLTLQVAALAAPVVLDLLCSLCYAFSLDKRYPLIPMANGAVFAVLELGIAAFFLYSAVSVNAVLRQISSDVNNQERHRRQFIRRLTICAFGIGLTMLSYFGASVIVALNDWFVRPPGWTATWAIYSLANSAKAVFHAHMLKPKKLTPEAAAPSNAPAQHRPSGQPTFASNWAGPLSVRTSSNAAPAPAVVLLSGEPVVRSNDPDLALDVLR